MPLYDYTCNGCGKTSEVLTPQEPVPSCCGEVMARAYKGWVKINLKYPLWVDRMDDIHKAQEQRGERFRYIHPKEVLA